MGPSSLHTTLGPPLCKWGLEKGNVVISELAAVILIIIDIQA